jgi:tape measure domain-containing protein
VADERFKVDLVAGDRYSREFTRFNRQMDAMVGSTNRFGRAIVAAFSVQAITNFGKELARTQRRFDAIDATFRSVEGSAAGAEAAFDDAAGLANTLGLDLISTAKSFAQFNAAAKGTALEGDVARDIFESLSIAASALQLDAYDTRGAMRALEQMISKGNVQAEELRGQLGERLPGAFQRAARAMDVTTSQLNDMLENGEVLAEDLLPKLAASLREDYTAGAQQGAQSLNGDVARLNNSLNETKLALSELFSIEEITEALGYGFAGLADILENLEEVATRAAGAMVTGNIRAQLEELDDEIGDIKGLKESFMGRKRFLASLPDEERESLLALERERRRLASQLEIANQGVMASLGLTDEAEGAGVERPDTTDLMTSVDGALEYMDKRSAEFAEDFAKRTASFARELDALRTPAQALDDDIARYVEGLAEGALTQEQFNALVLAARDNFLESSPVMQAVIEEQERLAEAQRESAAAQQDAFELFSDLDPFVAYANAVRELTDAFNLLTPEQIAALGGAERVQEVLDENIAKLGERLNDVQETGDLFSGLEEGLAGAITRGVTDGADGALDAFAQLLQQMAVQALQSQLSDVLSDVIGSLGGIIGGAAGATSKSAKKIPGKAVGGTVTGGKTYLVGERGPELFTAGRTGTITPNNAMGGGLTYAPVVTIQGGATEQDRILFQRQLDQQKAEIFDLARRGRL